jgi:hypothetical protein
MRIIVLVLENPNHKNPSHPEQSRRATRTTSRQKPIPNTEYQVPCGPS